MGIKFVVGVLLVAAVVGEESYSESYEGPRPVGRSDTDLKLVFAIFRHGDRTPDHEELILYPVKEKLNDSIFYPFGMKALTNKGKQRGFFVGAYLRRLYDGFISKLYLPDEMVMRTTKYDRTKMTALAALAALYPPPPAQRWHPDLDWQPVPYDTLKFEDDDFMYWYNCPRYTKLKSNVYEEPEVIEWLKPYEELGIKLRERTGTNIKTPEDFLNFDNLLQTLKNVGVSPPKWLQDIWMLIKGVTIIEYRTEFYTAELRRLSSGVLMNDILNYTSAFISGDEEQPKMRLFSAHENNVAALLACARVFEPHQPSYGATLSLELRQGQDKQYYITAVYTKDTGGPTQILPVQGCGGGELCEYEKFVSLVQENVMTKEEFLEQCQIVPS